MSWLEREAWEAEDPREVDGALVAAIAADPRRVVALIGPPGAAPGYARAIARRWPGPAWAGDGAVDALEAALAGVAADASPLVVLDGRAALGALAERRLHPRLRVIVPCDPSTAPDVPELAALPRASILVAVFDGDALAPPAPRDGPPAWVAPAEGDALDRRVAEARLRRDKPALAAALAEILSTVDDPARRARAGGALASLTRDVALAEAAAEDARRAGDDVRAEALAQLADLRMHAGDLAGARAAYADAIALLDARGAVGRAALLRSFTATIASEAGDFDGACEAIARAIADRRALGDAMGAALALGRLARWEVERGRADDARRAAEAAAALSAAIGDPRGVGYARWFLGALAERAGDGVAAMAHYAASLDAYAELGDVPERVVSSLATLQRAYDGTPAPRAPLPEPEPEPLVPLGRRST